MTPTDRYVTHSDITFMTSTQLKHLLLLVWHDEMNHPRAILFESQTLQKEIVSVLGNVLLHIDKSVRYAIGSENIWIWFFADLALKLLPSVGDQVLFLFLGHLLLEPVLEALIMNEPDRAITLTTIE